MEKKGQRVGGGPRKRPIRKKAVRKTATRKRTMINASNERNALEALVQRMQKLRSDLLDDLLKVSQAVTQVETIVSDVETQIDDQIDTLVDEVGSRLERLDSAQGVLTGDG